MKPSRIRNLLILFAAVLAIPVASVSTWEYIPPLYACSPTLNGCGAQNHQCLANPNHPQSTTDDACLACGMDQKYWPCDVDGLCYCWDKSRPKIPPAPSTRIFEGGRGLNVSAVDPCALLTPAVFERLAPAAQAPYSYAGFCSSVRKYNENHPGEGAFNMGSPEQQRAELAAFFGNALHESDEFRAGREYLMCADRIEMGGEVYCRPCDAGSFDWDTMTCPPHASLASEGRAFNSYCQSNLLPPEGCRCDDVYERSERGPMAGFVKANQVYFGRGSIQLSWNYNYIRASVALTGAAQTFCQRPDLVATNEEYAWGAGLFYWMENVKNDKTCHQSVLLNQEFGETLDNINGGLECPADDHGWHGKAIVLRLNRYCRAATALEVGNLLSLDGCMDMEKRMRQCLAEGTCRECKVWEDKITKTNDDEDGVTEDNGNNGGKNKDKNKQGSDAPGGNTKAAKQKDKEKKEQEAAAAAAKQNESMSNGTNPADVITVEESPAPPTQSPTSQPKHQPTTSDPTYSPTEDPSLIGCSGEPCHISNNIKNIVFEFCRSADGICGTGPQYCNSAAIWTASCQSDGNHNVYDTTIPTTYYPTIAMPVMPPEGLQAAGGSANKYDDASTSLMTSAKETPQGVRPPLRRTQRPTAEPSPDPAPRPLSAAGQFGVVPTSITGPSAAATANSNGKITETPPNSSSHANQFATATHSKGRNNGQATATSARPKPDAASPADSPVGSPEGEGVSSASKFGGMTNWANTKLDYPPTVSPVVVTSSPVDASNAPTHLPTLLPTKKPVQTTNIADTLHDQSKELNQKSTVIVETVPETELENQHSSGSSSTNESDVSDTFNPPASLREDISVDSSTVAKASRYTALGDDSYLFFPMDDVTISRSFPSSNFGSEPSIVVDMLDGDAALLRFDLSIVGDSVIEKATLRLTSHSEDGVGGSAGVYYIQPTVNGWTEESVTYSTAPKTDGSLFASVASLRNSEDDANNNQYEMDVTDVAANHIISFRVIGTDRVRKEFCSKESSEANDAPLILVKLDSLNSELVRDTIILPTKQKPMVAKVTAGNSNDQSPTPSASSSGSIFGHIWLDRNADGVKESNEPGLRGILVDLYQCDDDTWLEGTRSAPGGEYIFEDLNGEGRYYVVVTTVSAEYGFAEKASTGSDSHARVSDVDPATGRGDCLDLSSTSNATGNQHIISASVNAGIIKKSMPLVTANEALDEVATTLDSPTVVASSDSDGESNDSSNHNCRGRACTEGGGYCRSKFNFCGLGEEYCNEDSQWTAECGTPSPTYPPSAEPTTGPPTFLHDPNVHCVGEPCYDEGDGTWCRSEIGYCGSGPLYCNSESSWSPDCNGVTGDSLPAPPTKSPSNPYSTTGAPIALKMGQVVATLAPPTPSPIEDITMFSQFASPTLPFIATPKQTGVGATSLNSQGTVKSEDEQSVSFLTDTSLPANTELSSSGREGPTTKKAMENDVRGDEPWYVRYSDVRPMPHNIGSRPIPGIVSALCFVASTLIRLL